MAAGWWCEPDELDDAQQKIAALPSSGRHLITGKPGSGKTNLLVLRAAYHIRSGHPNIKVLTWGRLISEFIATGSQQHELDESQLTTFMTWGQSALREANVRIELKGEFEEQMRQLMSGLEVAANQGALSRYDAILIDEVQDYPPEALSLIASLTERLFFAGDEHQRIYQEHRTLEYASGLVDETISLPFHYRNGHQICRVAQHIYDEKDYLAASRYDERSLPSRVSLRCFPSLKAQVEQLVVDLRDQMRTYPNEWLGVMVPLNKDADKVVELLRESEVESYCEFQTRTEGNAVLEEERPIIVSTIHAAKGLEYRAAHILAMEGIERFPSSKRRNIAYTAVTRAKTSLYGYHTEPIQNWLKSAFLAGSDPIPPPTLVSLFR
ncbi:MAG: AAA family ATPase [Candidatus Eremiobacteraeota bacterium]|nr:AAA family ATPase [Candidatus Eremiobacteraeota bacterium]